MDQISEQEKMTPLNQDLGPVGGYGAGFPSIRMRRLRQADWSRRMVRESDLSPSDLIWPLFVVDGENKRIPVESMPGVNRLSIDLAVAAAEEAAELRIPAIALFPYTENGLRNEEATEAFNPDNLVCRAVRAIKSAVPDIGILCDVALDPYTSHGHDGLLVGDEIANDKECGHCAVRRQGRVRG